MDLNDRGVASWLERRIHAIAATKASERASVLSMEGKERSAASCAAQEISTLMVGALVVAALLLWGSACTDRGRGASRVHASTSALNATLGIALRSVSLGDVKLERTTFSASSGGQDELSSMRFSGRTMDGRTVSLRIDDQVNSTQADVFHYEVSYSIDGGGSWKSLCGVTPLGEKIRAIPLSGVWDDSRGKLTSGSHLDEAESFTFACRSSAIAACVDMGYRPWNQVTECSASGVCKTISGWSFHQACTRMLRADYCGDGTAHTQDAAPIDAFDGFGIQKSGGGGYSFEAEWTPSGARCIEHVRSSGESSKSALEYVQTTCPWRLASAQRAYDCGGEHSTLHTQIGFHLPVGTRSLLASRAP